MPDRRHLSRTGSRRPARSARSGAPLTPVVGAGRLSVVRIVQDGDAPAVNGSLALARHPVHESRRRAHLTLVGGDGPSRAEVAEATVRLIAEVLAGIRPPRGLVERAVPHVWQTLAVLQGSAAARPGAGHAGRRPGPVVPPRVVRTRVQEPVPGVLEIAATVVLNARVHALALRLDRHRGRWRCTALETTALPSRP